MLRKVRIRNGLGLFTAWVHEHYLADAHANGGFVTEPAFEPAEARNVVDWINDVARFHVEHGYEPISLALWDGDNVIVLIEDYQSPNEDVTRIHPDQRGRFRIGTNRWGWKYADDLVN